MGENQESKVTRLPIVWIGKDTFGEDVRQIPVKLVRDWIIGSYTNGDTANVTYRNFRLWFNWAQENTDLKGKTVEDLVNLQNTLNENKKEDDHEILNTIVQFLGSDKEWRTQYKFKLYQNIRGFFTYTCRRTGGFPKIENGHKAVFENDKQLKVEKKLDNDIIREIVNVSIQSPVHKAIFSIMAMSGMGINEILKWSEQGIDSLKEALANPVSTNPELIEVRLSGRKQGAKTAYVYYNIIGGSALRNLKIYLKERETKALTKKKFPTQIFVSNHSKPITQNGISAYWLKKLKQIGKYATQPGKGRKQRSGENVHQIRSVFRTNWEDSPSKPIMGEYFLGHIVDPLGYNQFCGKADKRILEYKKALPYIDLWTTISPNKQNEETLEELERVKLELKKVLDAEAQWRQQSEERMNERIDAQMAEFKKFMIASQQIKTEEANQEDSSEVKEKIKKMRRVK